VGGRERDADSISETMVQGTSGIATGFPRGRLWHSDGGRRALGAHRALRDPDYCLAWSQAGALASSRLPSPGMTEQRRRSSALNAAATTCSGAIRRPIDAWSEAVSKNAVSGRSRAERGYPH